MTNDTTPALIGADALIDELDAAGTATVEDGSIAKLALAGHVIQFEGEAATAPSEQAPAQPAAVAGPSERVAFEMWVRKSTTEVPHRDQYGFYDEPVSEWWKVWQARAAAPTAHAAQPAYLELPDFDAVEQHIYAGCRRFIDRDMLEPIHSLIREAVDADRASRGQAPAETAADILERIAEEPPINGNSFATARVLMAAQALRDQPTTTQPVPAQAAPVAQPAILGPEHKGMRVDYSGLFKQARGALARGIKEPALAEMLRQFQGHMQELGQRWYAGDTAVIDELLQLYCIEQGARAQAKEGQSHE